MTDWESAVQALANAATAVGIFFAAFQVRQDRIQERTAFEDALAREYRELCQQLPVEALLALPLAEDEVEKWDSSFFRYFTLTNDQIFMRRKNRISKDTWADWAEGIADNLEKPAFLAAWKRLKEKSPKSFGELRKLEEEGFSDPTKWKSAGDR